MANRSRISELSPQRNDWSIRVKVLKKWSEMIDGGGDILRFLLVDEFGGKIPAKVSPEFGLYDRFNFDVHEDHWKIFTGFIVELASTDFRFTVNDHCIIFTENTEVHNSGGVHQDHYMNFKDYIDIKNGVYSSHYPIDLIGYLENVGELKVARDQNFTLANNKKTNKVTFLIKNLGGDILECKAYGVLAFQLYDKWWRHGDTETFITMSDWMVYMDPRTNEIKIKDAGGISRFEFNGPYQDVFDFSYEYFHDSDGSVEESVKSNFV